MRLIIACLALLAGPALAGEGALPHHAVADYQLGGGYPPPKGVTIVVRDSLERPEPGYFNICYVNGFQTQPGEAWPERLLLKDPKGRPLADPAWPDEYLLDISTPALRTGNLGLVLPALKRCAERGFDAVEFDNLDSYSRSGGRLSLDDAAAYAALLVKAARDLGLPAGQKNTAELGSRGRDEIGFAFAVSESCHRYGECAAYTDVYGASQVLGIEYAEETGGRFDDACRDPDRPGSLILRDRLLAPAGREGHVFEACPAGSPSP